MAGGISLEDAYRLFPLAQGKDPCVIVPTNMSDLDDPEKVSVALAIYKESERVIRAMEKCSAERAAENYRIGLGLDNK